MRYMQGHLRGAVNLPAVRLFGREGKLLSVYELAEYFGSGGRGNDTTVTMYDGGDGRNAAMAAWTLEYLGHTNVRIMDVFFEQWAAQGREKLYRPVRPTANTLEPMINPSVRATLEDGVAGPGNDSQWRQGYIAGPAEPNGVRWAARRG